MLKWVIGGVIVGAITFLALRRHRNKQTPLPKRDELQQALQAIQQKITKQKISQNEPVPFSQ